MITKRIEFEVNYFSPEELIFTEGMVLNERDKAILSNNGKVIRQVNKTIHFESRKSAEEFFKNCNSDRKSLLMIETSILDIVY